MLQVIILASLCFYLLHVLVATAVQTSSHVFLTLIITCVSTIHKIAVKLPTHICIVTVRVCGTMETISLESCSSLATPLDMQDQFVPIYKSVYNIIQTSMFVDSVGSRGAA